MVQKFHEIALWGPSSSGKTWLMLSLGKALEGITIGDPEFKYLLEDEHGKPLENFAELVDRPTEEAQDIVWVFRRVGKRPTPAHTLSSYSHHIILHDAKGEETVTSDANGSRIVQGAIEDAQCVLIVLDPTLLRRTPSGLEAAVLVKDPLEGAGTKSGGNKLTYTPEEYTTLVRKLFDTLKPAASAANPKHIAVCVTKMDQYKLRREPWKIVEAFFGKEMHTLLKEWPESHLNTFCISAAGYLPNQAPNFDPITKTLADTKHWTPHYVEAPFFWLFEQVERERLAQRRTGLVGFFQSNPLKNYIPYPIRRK